MTDPKALLMPVYTRGNEIERLRGALSLACFFGAHLEVLHAQTKPSDLLEAGPFGLSNDAREHMIAIMDEDAIRQQQDLEAHFSELCQKYGVAISNNASPDGPTACWIEIKGARSELVAQRGRVSDLIIIPRSVSGEPTQTFEAAILHTARPVLLVPRGLTQISSGKVLVAWSGSEEAARSVQYALPFLKRANSVLIVSGQDVASEKPDGNALKCYLKQHGINVDYQILEDSTRSSGEELLDTAEKEGIDLLVMGGYTHTRWRQQILGGVTHHMLKHAEIPVLMAH